MELLDRILVLIHLLGMAAIVGSAVFVSPKVVTPALVWGARAQLITGVLLVGLMESLDEDVNHTKIGVKLAVAIAVAACAEIANAKAKKGEGRPQLVMAAGALALLNTAIAVFWH